MGSSSSPSHTTQTSEPPAFIQPYLQRGAQESLAAYEQGGQQYYPGNTVVPFSPQTETMLGLTEQRAINGSPVNNAAQGFATRTLNNAPQSQFGAAQNPYGTGVNNPYLDATFNRAADRVQNRLQTSFSGAGRNIDAGRPVAAQEMGDLAAQIYGGAYESERNRGFQGYEAERGRMANDIGQQRGIQATLAGMAPSLAAQDYVDLEALGGVGSQVEDLTGRLMEDQAARWDFNQNRPQVALDNYLARVTGAYPGQNATQTTPTYRNRGAGALGGAATGAQIGMAFGAPWLGAAAGGLLGAFG